MDLTSGIRHKAIFDGTETSRPVLHELEIVLEEARELTAFLAILGSVFMNVPLFLTTPETPFDTDCNLIGAYKRMK